MFVECRSGQLNQAVRPAAGRAASRVAKGPAGLPSCMWETGCQPEARWVDSITDVPSWRTVPVFRDCAGALVHTHKGQYRSERIQP